jgi:hypothetical protein
MNLEQAIHQRWAASDALATLLPTDRVTTGRSFGHALPYATITRRSCRTPFRTNAGALDEVALRIHVWHDDYDRGRSIVDELKATFDRSDFPLTGGARVVQMRRADDSAVEHNDGTWQFAVEFLVQVHLPSEV